MSGISVGVRVLEFWRFLPDDVFVDPDGLVNVLGFPTPPELRPGGRSRGHHQGAVAIGIPVEASMSHASFNPREMTSAGYIPCVPSDQSTLNSSIQGKGSLPGHGSMLVMAPYSAR